MGQLHKFIQTYKYYLLLVSGCFFLGMMVFLFKRSWLIMHWVPGYARSDVSVSPVSKHIVHRKKLALYYWKDDQLKREVDSFVWRGDAYEDLKIMVGSWLSFLYEERVVRKRVSLESIALGASKQDLLVSFDHYPFEKDWSIRKKWQFLDGLCRTIAGVNLGVQSILFLVNHERLQDDHLDFSQPWPVTGFGS